MSVPVMTIDGDVIAVHSYWTDDGSRIETDATVLTADGQQVVVNQLGGSADGLTMVQFPGPPMLELGMHVAVAAHKGLDELQQEHIVLDSAKVIAYAPGYVRTGPTTGGHSLFWESGCAFVTVDAAGTTAIAGDGEFTIIDQALDEWNNKTASCSYFKVKDAGRKAMEVGNDRVNLIKFRDAPCTCDNGTTSWGCRPAVGKSPMKCYQGAAAAITTAVYVDACKDPDTGGCLASCMDSSGRCVSTSSRDGAIVDADIEVNGVDFGISAGGVTSGPAGRCLADLQNTLTHELGHLHGLEHTCLASGDSPRIDNQGNPVPSCSTVQAAPALPANMAILDATMYNFQECGETKKSSLSMDDIQSMCDIYPTSKDPGTCEAVAPTGGGCACSSGSGGPERPAGAVFLAGAVMMWMRRRKRARAR